MRTPARRIAASAVALGLLLSACGGDDDDNATSTTTEAADEASTTTADDMASEDTSETTAAETDIVDTAVAAGDFTTLVAAVQAAGLEETLKGEGPYTVFAPTDDAFAKLPAGTVDTLLEDPEGDLTDILTYHVVEGEVLAADVVELDGKEVATVNGATFTVNVGDDGSVTLTDGAGNDIAVTTTDIQTTNGVIHVIDTVMMPS